MLVSRVSVSLLAIGAFLAWGCSYQPEFVAKDEPWRADLERSCLTSGIVHKSAFLAASSALGGPSVCGAIQPFEMFAAMDGRVLLTPAAVVRCPMVPAIESWVRDVIDPAARYHFGAPVAELKVAGSYSCRPMNHVYGAQLSEHGYANAIDIAAFVLANGKSVDVKTGWWGGSAERNFLRDVHHGGCQFFSTVLGPDANENHRDHFHLDLARRRDETRICK
jgi:hypothetical protein